MLKGFKLGKYEVIEELGMGGFGTVYRVQDTVLNVERALKVLHPPLVADPVFLSRFQKEAQLAARLDHPNLVPVYDFGEEDGRFFLAMKYMQGGSLKDLLEKGGQLDEQRVFVLLEQIGKGVDYAHSQGVVHRDLKPRNILFDQDGNLRVSDMGFAKSMSEGSSSSLTLSGGMVGTPSYMAPEIWRAKPATPASDMYSMGCILYEMLTGTVLFDGDSPADVMTKHVLDGPVIGDDISEPIHLVIAKALARNPQDRYASVAELISALKEPVSDLGGIHKTVEVRGTDSEDLAQKPPQIPQVLQTENQTPINNAGKPSLPGLPPKDGESIKSAPIRLENQPKAKRNVPGYLKKHWWFAVPVFVAVIALVLFGVVQKQNSFTGFYYSSGGTYKEIYFLSPDGKSTKIVDSLNSFDSWDPFPSTNGYTYFTCDLFGKKAEICVRDSKGNVTQITDSPNQSQSWDPAPTNGNLYYTSDQYGQNQLVLMVGDGIWSPVFPPWVKTESCDAMPTSEGIVYYTFITAGGKAEIAKFDSKGNGSTAISLVGNFSSWDPTPAINGNLYFTADLGGQTDIYVMDSNQNISRVVPLAADSSAWNPVPDNHGNLYFTSDMGGSVGIYIFKKDSEIQLVLNTPGNLEGKVPTCNRNH